MFLFTPTFRVRSEPARADPKPLHRKATVVVIGAIAFASIAGGAQAQSGAPINSVSNQSGQICQAVIGVQPTDYHFAGCVASLDGSLQSARHDDAVARAQSDCFKQGLKPHSADLSLCLLKADDAKFGTDPNRSPDELGMAANGMEYPEAVGSYTSASFDVVFHREQEACARLGIDPDSGAFAGCVSSLQDQLQKIDFPSS
jgi:hypothetical protein